MKQRIPMPNFTRWLAVTTTVLCSITSIAMKEMEWNQGMELDLACGVGQLGDNWRDFVHHRPHTPRRRLNRSPCHFFALVTPQRRKRLRMNRAGQRNFSARRNNLTEIPKLGSSSDLPNIIAASSPPYVPSPTFSDSDEEDAELKALRQAALSSRKPEKKTALGVPVSNGRPLSTSSTKKTASGTSISTVNSSTHAAADSRSNGSGKRQAITSTTSSRGQQQKTSVRASKYDDLDLEDLERVYRASKRSRFDRRNNSDDSSDEDDDFEYATAFRRTDHRSDNSPRPTFERNGYHSGGSSLSPPPSETNTHTMTNNGGGSRNSLDGARNSVSPFPSAVEHQRPSPVLLSPASPDRDPRTAEEDAADAAMERRKQKFGLVAPPLSPTPPPAAPPSPTKKVSLTSLKSNSSGSPADTEKSTSGSD
ncbi:hypothetical protein BV898_10165 [Hypsibius exemplaris]|uniref:Uncharacterized protein n=1 Tax=Hypsibius exemplaris TaxID=2072580 RepID=A0A1W0WKF6_HYPEX|nr:hypothetical protein BV898_10165 [Hypsibius exemplaris]